ncbi:MAG: TrbC/VIRB2 family protein [Parcubacteria group bacterium ADurb.Bin326]|nr:MAG: TrbC/VIRB2 family protein [Parcubacteria group bacterium ADurb.Bin326]
MNRKKISLYLLCGLLVLGATPVFAVQLDNPLASGGVGVSGVTGLVNQLIKFVLGFTGLLALLAFIYGGILWMSSMGDPKKVEKGKQVMIWSVYGLAVIFASYGIVLTLFEALGIK